MKKLQILKNEKTNDLIDLLLKPNFHQTLPLKLTIVTCFLKPKAAKELIYSLFDKNYNISTLDIYMDRGIALEEGKEKLNNFYNELKSKYNSVKIEFNLINEGSGNMFHCKAYCLSQFHSKFGLLKGSLVVTSANLTYAALNENIEILLQTDEIQAISSFFEDLNLQKIVNLSKLEDFLSDQDEYYFIYALIKEGIFIDNEDYTINQELNYKYKFNLLGKKEMVTAKNKRHQEKLIKGSLTINYFGDISKPDEWWQKFNPYYSINWGSFGVNSNRDGKYWLPKYIIVNYLNTLDIKSCKNSLKKKLEEKYQTALDEMKEDFFDYFVDKYWIDHEICQTEYSREFNKKKNSLNQSDLAPAQKEEELRNCHINLLKDKNLKEKVKQEIVSYCQNTLKRNIESCLSDENIKRSLLRYKINEKFLRFYDRRYDRPIVEKTWEKINDFIEEKLIADRKNTINSVKNLGFSVSFFYEKNQPKMKYEEARVSNILAKHLYVSLEHKNLDHIRTLKPEYFLPPDQDGRKNYTISPKRIIGLYYVEIEHIFYFLPAKNLKELKEVDENTYWKTKDGYYLCTNKKPQTPRQKFSKRYDLTFLKKTETERIGFLLDIKLEDEVNEIDGKKIEVKTVTFQGNFIDFKQIDDWNIEFFIDHEDYYLTDTNYVEVEGYDYDINLWQKQKIGNILIFYVPDFSVNCTVKWVDRDEELQHSEGNEINPNEFIFDPHQKLLKLCVGN